MKALSSVDIYYLVKELKYIENARLDKIYMPDKKELLLQLHVPSKGKTLLRIIAGKVFYVTDHKPAQQEPSGFCLYLRKHIKGRLRALRQLESERIIELVFETQENSISLIIEFFNKGNILVVQDDSIKNTAEQQKWKDRIVKAKEKFTYPHKDYNFITIKKSELKHLVESSEKESIVKALAIDLGIGGIAAEKLCENVDKNVQPITADVDIIYNNLQTLRNAEIQLNSTLQELWKAPPQPTESKEERKFRSIVESQTKNLDALKSKELSGTKSGEAIYNNYTIVQRLLDEVNVKQQKYSLQALQEQYKDHPLVKSIDPKNKTVTIEL